MDINLNEILVVGANDYGTVVEEPLPKATEEQVAGFESKVGFILPADYREFLLTINGGGPNLNKIENVEYEVIPVTSDPRSLSGTNILEYLYPLGDDTLLEVLGESIAFLTLESRYSSFCGLRTSDYPFVPENCIPIGTPLGNQSMLLLCLAGELENNVLDYEHQRDPTEQNGNVSIAGTSFTEFVNSWRIVSY